MKSYFQLFLMAQTERLYGDVDYIYERRKAEVKVHTQTSTTSDLKVAEITATIHGSRDTRAAACLRGRMG